MKLRQKKTNNLSGDLLYQVFQNSHLQTFNRKADLSRKTVQPFQTNQSLIDRKNPNFAEILSSFMTNCNKAKQARYKKPAIKSSMSSNSLQSIYKTKRIRKTWENTSFEEQKKIDHPKTEFIDSERLRKKKKSQQKRGHSSDNFSISKIAQAQPDSLNLRKQLPEQNIINNFLAGNKLNIQDYARFMHPQFIALNSNLMNPWLQMNPFFKPNLENIAFFTEQMKNGLYRQLQIYERFKPEKNAEQIQKKPLPFSNLNQNDKEKSQKKTSQIPTGTKLNPIKIFKRASYHVGIAYSIYMDNIQKQGRQIRNFSDIDPTRFARKYKSSMNTY